VTWGGQHVKVIGTKRARSHHLNARQAEPVPLLNSQAAKELVAVRDQQERASQATSGCQPP
jgi:hypothetical protein